MCRKLKGCTELESNPDNWSRECPLKPPSYFDESLDFLVKAYQLASKGQKKEAVKTLHKTRSNDLREWFMEHGSYSGWKHRVNILNKPVPEKYLGEIESRRYFYAIEKNTIHIRDNYSCRYCGIRVLDMRVLKKLEKMLGREHFKATGKTNMDRHGTVFAFKATIDHVDPISNGGKTTIHNGVTACWNCNLGKYNALLSQMGMDDPRDRPFVIKELWDGLLSSL